MIDELTNGGVLLIGTLEIFQYLGQELSYSDLKELFLQ